MRNEPQGVPHVVPPSGGSVLKNPTRMDSPTPNRLKPELHTGERGTGGQTTKYTKEKEAETCTRRSPLPHPVPGGQTRIAQRFNAGLDMATTESPKGRLNSYSTMKDLRTLQPPLRDSCVVGIFPALKRRAIFKMSLRDKARNRRVSLFLSLRSLRSLRPTPPNSIMKNFTLFFSLALLFTGSIQAFPPAPYHLFYGMVRDELGNPINAETGLVILESGSGVQVSSSIALGIEPGISYRLPVPMDAGVTSDAYRPTALRPLLPFKMRVRIGNRVFLPIEMAGDFSSLGDPGGRTRIDLTLGEDSDGDGLPDAWERALLAHLGGDLRDVNAGDDTDGDGLSNLDEYISGSYAFDKEDGFLLTAVPSPDGPPLLEFLAIKGRTYTLHGSANLVDWVQVPFQLAQDPVGTGNRQNYQAIDIRTVQVHAVPPENNLGMRMFKLMVE